MSAVPTKAMRIAATTYVFLFQRLYCRRVAGGLSLLVAILLFVSIATGAQIDNKTHVYPAELNGLSISIKSVSNTKHPKYMPDDFKGLYYSNLVANFELKNTSSYVMSVVNLPQPPRSYAVLFDSNGKLLCDMPRVIEASDFQVEHSTIALKPGESCKIEEDIFALTAIPPKGKYFVVVNYRGQSSDAEEIFEVRVNKQTGRQEQYFPPNRPPFWAGPKIQSKPYEINLPQSDSPADGQTIRQTDSVNGLTASK